MYMIVLKTKVKPKENQTYPFDTVTLWFLLNLFVLNHIKQEFQQPEVER